jgi:diadenosine tetraphosphatase ApaH/serine/threonine PP2A family protein phosphatase
MIGNWPLTVELDVDGLGRVLFCHATPVSDTAIVTRITPAEDVLRAFGSIGAATVVCGHTHVQFDRVLDGLRVVNAGSVGAPYEDTPDPRWAIFGPDVELLTTPYDADAAFTGLLETGFPGLDDWIGAIVRGEIGADEATAEFESRRVAASAS